MHLVFLVFMSNSGVKRSFYALFGSRVERASAEAKEGGVKGCMKSEERYSHASVALEFGPEDTGALHLTWCSATS